MSELVRWKNCGALIAEQIDEQLSDYVVVGKLPVVESPYGKVRRFSPGKYIYGKNGIDYNLNSSNATILVRFKINSGVVLNTTSHRLVRINNQIAIYVNTTYMKIGSILNIGNGNVGTAIDSNTVIVPDTWYTLAVVIKAGVNKRYYLNGVQVKSIPITGIQINGTLGFVAIGGGGTPSGVGDSGESSADINELIIFKRELSNQEILDHHNHTTFDFYKNIKYPNPYKKDHPVLTEIQWNDYMKTFERLQSPTFGLYEFFTTMGSVGNVVPKQRTNNRELLYAVLNGDIRLISANKKIYIGSDVAADDFSNEPTFMYGKDIGTRSMTCTAPDSQNLKTNLNHLARGLVSINIPYGPDVSGNIAAIPPTVTSVNLQYCSKVVGNLNEIENPDIFVSFVLIGAKTITGSIETFSNATFTGNFKLEGCPLVIGDIGSLPIQGLPSNAQFSLSGCSGITGNVSILENIEANINLSGCVQLTGSLPVLPNQGRYFVYLSDCENITGDIANIGEVYDLQISNCPLLTGDIGALYPYIDALHAKNCIGLTGTLVSISGFPLSTLDLSGCTGITGSFNDISGLSNITTLRMNECAHITGTLGFVSGLWSLSDLQLHGCTSLTGSLASVKALEGGISSVDLSGCTGITGTIMDIPYGANINLTGCSQITGSIADLSGVLGAGATIILSNCTAITGDLSSIVPYISGEYLDLSGCSLITGLTTDIGGVYLSRINISRCPLITGDLGGLITGAIPNIIASDCPGITGSLPFIGNGLGIASVDISENPQLSGTLQELNAMGGEFYAAGCTLFTGSFVHNPEEYDEYFPPIKLDIRRTGVSSTDIERLVARYHELSTSESPADKMLLADTGMPLITNPVTLQQCLELHNLGMDIHINGFTPPQS